MTLWQRLEECLVQTFGADHGTHFQQSAQYNHVEHLPILHLCRLVHSVDTVDGNILPGRWVHDTVSVIDENAARLQLGFKLIQRRLVQDYGNIKLAQDGRRDTLIADDDRHIGGTSTLFRSVCRHPSHFLVLHQTGIRQNLTHREYTLTAETADNYFCFHNVSFKSPFS